MCNITEIRVKNENIVEFLFLISSVQFLTILRYIIHIQVYN